jgi:hypothetical protein
LQESATYSDKIKVEGGRHEKDTVLILAMMIMFACFSCFWGVDHDRHGHGDGDRGGMAIMIKVEAEDTIKARAEYIMVGIKGISLNAARAERAVFG